jgi:hypothetical protein
MAIPKISQQPFQFLFPPLFFSILSLLLHTSFIHPISLPSSLSVSRRSFPSLSLISSHPLHMCSIVLAAHSAPSLLSLRPIPGTLSLQVHRNILCHASGISHTPCYTCILSLLPCLSVSLSLSRSSALIDLPVIVHFNYFLLHRFPPVKPCANEHFRYPLVVLRLGATLTRS